MFSITEEGDAGAITAHSESLSAAMSGSATRSCQVAASRAQPLQQQTPPLVQMPPCRSCLRHLQIFLAAHRTDLHSP